MFYYVIKIKHPKRCLDKKSFHHGRIAFKKGDTEKGNTNYYDNISGFTKKQFVINYYFKYLK
jgi:hypothetical protein